MEGIVGVVDPEDPRSETIFRIGTAEMLSLYEYLAGLHCDITGTLENTLHQCDNGDGTHTVYVEDWDVAYGARDSYAASWNAVPSTELEDDGGGRGVQYGVARGCSRGRGPGVRAAGGVPRELHRCFAKRPDALSELADAVLCKQDRMHMLAVLPLLRAGEGERAADPGLAVLLHRGAGTGPHVVDPAAGRGPPRPG